MVTGWVSHRGMRRNWPRTKPQRAWRGCGASRGEPGPQDNSRGQGVQRPAGLRGAGTNRGPTAGAEKAGEAALSGQPPGALPASSHLKHPVPLCPTPRALGPACAQATVSNFPGKASRFLLTSILFGTRDHQSPLPGASHPCPGAGRASTDPQPSSPFDSSGSPTLRACECQWALGCGGEPASISAEAPKCRGACNRVRQAAQGAGT